MPKLLTKILWSQQQKWQFLFAGGGFFLGLLMVLVAVQVFVDINRLIEQRKRGQENEYLLITKNVSAVNTLSALSKSFQSYFTEDDLQELQEQDFIKSYAVVATNQFDVQSDLAEQLDMYADLFFESVPDAYLDTIPEKWGWQPGQKFVPVIMSKDWLDIYNFNVSMMYNLPQLSPATIQGMDFHLLVRGNARSERYNARIVGFSYRMPSLTIPHDFMEYANENFGSGKVRPSKIMIEVEDASDPQLINFLERKNYDADRERMLQNSFQAIAEIIYSLTAIIGILFLLLSVIIFIITLQLMIAKAREKINLLLMLGYRPYTLTRNLLVHFLKIVLVVSVVAFLLFFIIHYFLKQYLTNTGWEVTGGISILALAGGIILVLLAILVNYLSIRRSIRKYF